MDDLFILFALAVWIGLWAARELGWCGVTREQASAAARRSRRRPRSWSDRQGGPDGPYVDAFGPQSGSAREKLLDAPESAPPPAGVVARDPVQRAAARAGVDVCA